MKEDWKKRIDHWEEKERLKKEEQERKEKQRKAKQIDFMFELAKFAHLWNLRFRCHICGKTSPEPVSVWDDPPEANSTYLGLDWNTPTNLHKCNRCDKWTCDDHLYRGICAKCARKL